MAREVATTSPIPRLTTRRLVPVSASASVTTQACHGAHPTDGLGHHRRSITPENHLRFPIVNPGEGEGGLPDDVVAISVATYSDDPGAFAAYGLNGVAGPFVKFAELLSPAATVLDAGCGPGRDLARLANLGHRGVGVDLNVDFVRRARREAPTIHGDLRALPLMPGYFDAVWASASLIHLPSDDAGVALSELARVAKIGAPLGISVRTGGITGWADDMPLGRRWFYNWVSDEFTTLIENAGLSVEEVSDDGLWIDVVARR